MDEYDDLEAQEMSTSKSRAISNFQMNPDN